MADTRRRRPLLGTFVDICVEGTGADADTAVTAAFQEVGRLHGLLSFQSPDSVLSRVNAAPGVWHDVPHDVHRVLTLARCLSRLSGGLFNPTVGGMMIDTGVLPAHWSHATLPYGGADDIDLRAGQVRLKRPVAVTLDGIAKGYAVDRAVAVLKRHGVRSGVVNAGGDLRAFGDRAEAVHRREADGSITALGHLKGGAIATSRVAAKPDDEFPGFTVAANIGIPQPGVWTVSARYAWLADALTKVAALANGADRADTIRRLHGALVG